MPEIADGQTSPLRKMLSPLKQFIFLFPSLCFCNLIWDLAGSKYIYAFVRLLYLALSPLGTSHLIKSIKSKQLNSHNFLSRSNQIFDGEQFQNRQNGRAFQILISSLLPRSHPPPPSVKPTTWCFLSVLHSFTPLHLCAGHSLSECPFSQPHIFKSYSSFQASKSGASFTETPIISWQEIPPHPHCMVLYVSWHSAHYAQYEPSQTLDVRD